EDRAAIGLLEVALPVADGAGEAALHVAEQLALEQLGRDSGHVDGHERSGGARAQAMDGAREQLLAGARFAGEQDGQRRAGRPAEVAEQRQHRRLARDDPEPRRRAAPSCWPSDATPPARRIAPSGTSAGSTTPVIAGVTVKASA